MTNTTKGTTNPSFKGESQKRFIRLSSLGDGYSAAELQAVIESKKKHIPRKATPKSIEPPKRKNQLLIDIQEKLSQGKGTGYVRWAKTFNLKQMAQTVAYLQNNGLMDYAVLSEKAATVSASYHAIADEIKTAEKRMEEIKEMEKHIINYSKTRSIYVAYRKAGYSKKFLAAHEGEIMLHKQAKQYFDSQGITKLPGIKSLRAEYGALIEKKKSSYSEFQKRREEMKEIMAAKANVDRILGMDERTERTAQREKQTEVR